MGHSKTLPLAEREARWKWPETTPLDAGGYGFLNHLRFVALGCRAKSRADLFKACALLTADKSQSARAHAEALVLCLNDALSKRAIFFRPGTTELSFDEAWLVKLATAIRRGDDASTQFLLRSRVSREHRRHVRFLVARISEQFSLI
ncbi:MAG: hypothetical protein AAFY31_17810 [Pseudomonadota bacterium]